MATVSVRSERTRKERRTKDEGYGTSLPRTESHEGMVDTAEEGGMVMMCVRVDPDVAALLRTDVMVGRTMVRMAVGGKGGADRGADEGQDTKEVVTVDFRTLVGVGVSVLVVDVGDDGRTAWAGGDDGIETKEVAEVVGGI